MKIFSHPLPIAWEYHVRTVLWRVHHGVGGRIVGEERDPREKKTYFFCVDQRTGRVLWERLALDEPWWVGITFVERDTVFLHGYASPDLPVERGVTAVEATIGKILWVKPDWTVESRSEHGLIVSSLDRTRVRHFEITPRTGDVLREVDAEEKHLVSAGMHSEDGGVISPVPATAASLDTETLRMVQGHVISDATRTMTECVDLPSSLVIDSQELSESDPGGKPRVRVVLRVLKKHSGKELFRDIIAASASGFVPGAFFVQNDILYYVRERSSLCAVSLPQQ